MAGYDRVPDRASDGDADHFRTDSPLRDRVATAWNRPLPQC
jgi:hypothetical protein